MSNEDTTRALDAEGSSDAGAGSCPRPGAQPPPRPPATVILVHGLWTPSVVCSLHAHWLAQRGYRTLRFGYPSVRRTLAENAESLRRCVAATGASDIHLVGHSLGGLLILEMLGQAEAPRVQRVVLLGTPCLGSHCAQRLAAVKGMPALLGRSIMQWLARPSDAAARRPTTVAVGVIAGTRSVGLGRIVPELPQPNDGVVTLAETRLPNASDFLALPLAHSQLLASRSCALQIASFLDSGRFQHAPAP
ncbi:alpha/beta fold hydrolase [Accumulibacter sp.]|jgi:pimeloyl-ACP methyl ester carboxylesterase|uniref:esterase/lipase family protein n=1 Tax=Accumulibacter sp. TaxID=2053492 RepID=UPI001AC4BA59|nr:alpha/beta fold hydrolase [Accumulibacter sp.]MBN8455411.1 alpha/beta fold hydrolase [Accumulibacter sp.]MBO3705157.1 alpha/beta fold hydrolase [Candidatus Accumulibacter conexus]